HQSYDQNDAIVGSDWLARYQAGTPDEQLAATRTLAHGDTPTVVHLDTLGRPFRSIAHNRTGGVDAFYHTRTELDIEGNTLSILDARQHELPTPVPTITQVFDVLARRISVVSADAGTRWMVADTAGKPLRAWDSRGHTLRSRYDALQRPIQLLVDSGGGNQVMTRTVFGEALDPVGPAPTDPNSASPAQALNLRGRPYLVFDGAGLVASDSVDFKGNVVQARRRIATEYLATPHWTALPDPGAAASLEADAISAGLLEAAEDFTSVTEFDALNRVRTATTPDNSVTRPVYNEAGLPEQAHV